MKRCFDVILALSCLLLLGPLMVIIAALVRVKIGSPILFKQVRPGLHSRPFTMYKFRTMTNEVDGGGDLLPDEMRVTRFGQFLRSTSLDELPEIINVLKGDMSFVGPRPLLMEYLPRYSKRQARRHEVRPGITGLAQINGRNAISWDSRLELDVQYIDHQSIWLDIKIIWRTLFKVLNREGISSKGHVTMPKFQGMKGQRDME